MTSDMTEWQTEQNAERWPVGKRFRWAGGKVTVIGHTDKAVKVRRDKDGTEAGIRADSFVFVTEALGEDDRVPDLAPSLSGAGPTGETVPVGPVDPDKVDEGEIAYQVRNLRIRDEARRRFEAEKAPPKGSLLDDLLTRDRLDSLPDPDPLIDGVLERYAYALLTGRKSTYKTFVALDWALCLATGKSWQGRPVERVKVLYVVGEGAHGLRHRVNAWEEAWKTKVDPEWFVVLPRAVNLHSGAELPDLLEAAKDKGLVVLDTLRRVSGTADENSSEMKVVIDNIEEVKRATADGSVLALAHSGKTDADTRGHSSIEDDADIVWQTKKEQDVLTLEARKMKNGPDGEKVELRATRSGGSLVIQSLPGEVAQFHEETSRTRVLRALCTTYRNADGATVKQIMETTAENAPDSKGVSESRAYDALNALLEDGVVNRRRIGNSQRWWVIDPDAHPEVTAYLRGGQE